MIKVRAYYTKLDYLKFLSHLDTVDLLRRAIYNTGCQVTWSQGYNPHMLMSFANPLPLGVSSEFEIFDISFEAIKNLDNLVEEINAYLPREIQIIAYRILEDKIGINEEYNHTNYEFSICSQSRLDKLNLDLEKDLYQTRKKKKGKKKIEVTEDISDFIKKYSQFEPLGNNEYKLSCLVETSLQKTINPIRLLRAIFDKYELDIDIDSVFVHKKSMVKL